MTTGYLSIGFLYEGKEGGPFSIPDGDVDSSLDCGSILVGTQQDYFKLTV